MYLLNNGILIIPRETEKDINLGAREEEAHDMKEGKQEMV